MREHISDDIFATDKLQKEKKEKEVLGRGLIAAGGMFSAIIQRNGDVQSSGSNVQGKLGIGKIDESFEKNPTRVHKVLYGEKISAGGFHSLVLNEDGTIWGWGSNDAGQIDPLNLNTVISSPEVVYVEDRVVEVSTGIDITAFLTENGDIVLHGHTAGIPQKIALQDKLDSKVVKISLNSVTLIVLTESGKVYRFDLTDPKGLYPRPVEVPVPIIDICVADVYTFLLLQEGKGVIVIENINKANVSAADLIPLSFKGTGIAGGRFGLFILEESGKIYKLIEKNNIEEVPNLTNIIDVSVGHNHCIALSRQGEIWTWGNNNYGQLGDGTQAEKLHPTRSHLKFNV